LRSSKIVFKKMSLSNIRKGFHAKEKQIKRRGAPVE
jgi:hypothetical protein